MNENERFELHNQIVRELENTVQNRNWWLWLLIEEGAPDVKVEGLGAEIDAWLAQGDPNGGKVLDTEQPWVVGEVVFRLRALPKSPDQRGSRELFGNPFAAVAYWTGH